MTLIPILGLVAAGRALESFPVISWRRIRPLMGVSDHSRVAGLRVVGLSMIQAGILPGDIAVVELGATAQIGDIVIACVPTGLLIKYLAASDPALIVLRSAHPGHADQLWKPADCRICGVVRRVERDL